jgi:hypothetical protein
MAGMSNAKPKLRASEARRIAVKASCDPRTVTLVYQTGEVSSMAAERAARVLEAEGLIPPFVVPGCRP